MKGGLMDRLLPWIGKQLITMALYIFLIAGALALLLVGGYWAADVHRVGPCAEVSR